MNSQPLAKIEGANVYYYHNDHLGTPQKMTDASGAVVWAADYTPFGETTITVSTITNNLRFPGQYYDAETGLHYNLNRVYNPPTGRYDEADPIGLSGGMNLYVYVENQPVNAADPEGLQVAIDPRTGRRLPPPPPAPARPPGYTPPFGDPVPGDKCLKCNAGAILGCIWSRPATPSSASNCARCIFSINPYTGTYDQNACSQCGAVVGMIMTDCVLKNCREGTRDNCLECKVK